MIIMECLLSTKSPAVKTEIPELVEKSRQCRGWGGGGGGVGGLIEVGG